jgi:C-terminal processing protease CtpA/Prc
MKAFLFCLVYLLYFSATSSVYGQPKEVITLLDSTISIMQQHSVNARLVNWGKMRKQSLDDAKRLSSPYQLGPVKGAGVKTALLEDNIGYLRIPGMQFTGKQDTDKNAQQLNDSLCYLLDRHVKGLVIDLRQNGGGAMYPMILGVQQLLEKGQIGSFESKKSEKWYLTDDSFSFDTTVLATIKPRCAIDGRTIPISFLISPPTGSSAEFLLIAFRGRPKTVLVGTKTAGFISGIEGFQINDAASVLLSTSYGKDRSGTVYKAAFKPDILVTSVDSFNNLSEDEKVKQAVKWLKQVKSD